MSRYSSTGFVFLRSLVMYRFTLFGINKEIPADVMCILCHETVPRKYVGLHSVQLVLK